jgi:hypothetical protein
VQNPHSYPLKVLLLNTIDGQLSFQHMNFGGHKAMGNIRKNPDPLVLSPIVNHQPETTFVSPNGASYCLEYGLFTSY